MTKGIRWFSRFI